MTPAASGAPQLGLSLLVAAAGTGGHVFPGLALARTVLEHDRGRWMDDALAPVAKNTRSVSSVWPFVIVIRRPVPGSSGSKIRAVRSPCSTMCLSRQFTESANQRRAFHKSVSTVATCPNSSQLC